MDFEDTYRSFYPPVSRFFLRRGHSAERARDLTQETFLGIYKGWATYRERGQLAAWVFRSAMNIHLKELRARNTGKRQGVEVPAEDLLETRALGVATDPGDRAIAGEIVARVERAIVELAPESRRHCLLLRLQGESYQAIAELLDLPFETVKSHLRRARQSLGRSLLEVDLAGVAVGPLVARMLDRLAVDGPPRTPVETRA